MKLEFILEKETRLDTGIAQEFPQYFSRSLAQKFIKAGKVTLKEKVCLKPSHKEELPAAVSIDYEPPPEYDLHPNDHNSVPILFQDAHLAIIHKPPNMTVHPGTGTADDTLVHVLLAQIKQLSDGSDPLRPGIVHRLDRETEGLMVVAKDNRTHFALSELFAERKITKEYHAWVWGLPPEKGDVEGYIGRHPVDRKKMLFDYIRINDSFKNAEMSYQVTEKSSHFSLIKILLKTGRTHQIRAAMMKLEHPVLGDRLYSRYLRRLAKTDIKRQDKEKIIEGGLYLVASRLAFLHPVTGEKMDFNLPLPERFLNIKKND